MEDLGVGFGRRTSPHRGIAMIARPFTHALRRGAMSAPRMQSSSTSVRDLSTRFCLLAFPIAALLACRVAVASPSEESAMNTTTAATATESAATSAVSQDQSIRPFKFHATQEQLDELRRRVKATKWPDKETVGDQSQGVQLATLRKLADYWGNEYDWRPFEARLQALPQFVTNID